MAWFNPLKGAHLTLGQLDKTLPVDITEVEGTTNLNRNIERGSVVFIKSANVSAPQFAIYTATEAIKPNAVPYIALQGVKDFTAGMAGNVGQAPEAQGIAKDVPVAKGSDSEKFLHPTNVDGAQSFLGPRITAISLLQAGEYETNNFDAKGYGDTPADFYVGEPLTVKDGKVTHWITGKNVIGYVTAKNNTRWVNDLGASVDGARISGGNTVVIAFTAAWIPAAVSENTVLNALSRNDVKPAAQAPAAQAPAAQGQNPGNKAK